MPRIKVNHHGRCAGAEVGAAEDLLDALVMLSFLLENDGDKCAGHAVRE
jgi:hypothetical protein